jgi:lipopolysaccharide exporter
MTAKPTQDAGVEPGTGPTFVPSTGRQAGWNYLVFALGKSSTLVMTVVLARLLSPAELGLFALALLVVNLFDYVKDLGIGAALVQRSESWDRLAPTGLTLSVGFGVLAAGLVAATADLAADAMNAPGLAGLVRALAVALLFSVAAVVPLARLRRELDFRKRLVPELAGAVVKTAVAITLAVQGFGAWSLVWAQLAAVIVTSTLYWMVSRQSLRFGFDRQAALALLRFGLPATAVALMAFAIYNVDYLAIGVRNGEAGLGLYTLAYRLPELVVLNLCVVVGDVLFSALSRMQDSRGQLASYFLSAMGAVVALTAPLGVAMAVLAPQIVVVLFGAQFIDSGPILALLALFAVVYAASFNTGDVYKAIGRPSILVGINIGKLAFMVGPIWWASSYGPVQVAAVLLGVEVAHFFVRMIVLRRVVEVSIRALALTVLRPLSSAVLMGLTLLLGQQLVATLPAILQLVLMSPVVVLAYAFALRMLSVAQFRQARTLVQRRPAPRPAPADPYLTAERDLA